MSGYEYQHLLAKAREAKEGGEASWSVQWTGEKVAVALVLNRADWLARMGYTLGEAIERMDRAWLEAIPRVERQLRDE